MPRHLPLAFLVIGASGCVMPIGTPPLRLTPTIALATRDREGGIFMSDATIVPQSLFPSQKERRFELGFGYSFGCTLPTCDTLRHGAHLAATIYPLQSVGTNWVSRLAITLSPRLLHEHDKLGVGWSTWLGVEANRPVTGCGAGPSKRGYGWLCYAGETAVGIGVQYSTAWFDDRAIASLSVGLRLTLPAAGGFYIFVP